MNLKRNYSTDFSRSVVQSTLTNVARSYAGFRGNEFSQQKVFDVPDVLDENGKVTHTGGETNRFSIKVASGIINAGFEPDELLPGEVLYDEKYIRVEGIAKGDDQAELRVTVRNAQPNDRAPTLETLEDIWA